MSKEREKLLWHHLEKFRGSQIGITFEELIASFADTGVSLELNDMEIIATKLHGRGMFFTPGTLSKYLCSLLKGNAVNSILDPFAGYGSFMLPVAQSLCVDHITAFTMNEDEMHTGQHFTKDNAVNWTCSDPFMALDELDEEFDLILSNFPWGWRRKSSLDEQFDGIRDDAGNMLLLKSALLLSDFGVGAFIVPEAFFWRGGSKSVVRNLASYGLAVDAYFLFGDGTIYPGSTLRGGIVLIRKGEQGELFAAEVGSNEQRNDAVIKNYYDRKAAKDVSSGTLVNLNDFTGFRNLVESQRLQTMAQRSGLPQLPLADVVKQIKTLKGQAVEDIQSDGESVFLPTVGVGLADTTPRTKNCLQLVVDTEKVIPQYLALFFNTELGRSVRSSVSHGTAQQNISRSALDAVDIYLPDIGTQLSVLGLENEIGILANELDELKMTLHSRPNNVEKYRATLVRINKEERFTDWLDELPFPLASILWSYYASGDSPQRQYEYLDHFFEALAEFMATILLSGIVADQVLLDEMKPRITDALSKQNLSLERSSFGTWVNIAAVLAKRVRAMLADKDDKDRCLSLFSAPNEEVLINLFSSKMISILQETNNLRNSWRGHGGVGGTSDKIAHGRVVILEGYLTELRRKFSDSWSRYHLVKSKKGIFSESMFHIDVELLIGARTPFAVVPVELREPMDDNYIYLLGQDASVGVKLLPFVKVMPSPKSAENACYFYNRCESLDSVRFVSHHFENEAEVTESFDDTIAALRLFTELSDSIGKH